MTTAFERVIGAIEVAGGSVKLSGDNRAIATCPAHEDRKPSLSLRRIETQVLVHCFAGCETEVVVGALGLRMADLYDSTSHTEYRYPGGRCVVRGPDKAFRQFGNMDDRSLFRGDRLASAIADGRTIFVVEGEKDVLALESIGEVATCSPMGAGKAASCDWSALARAKVAVVADRDAPGLRHASDVRAILDTHGCEVRVVQAAEGKDAADHVASGHDAAEFIAVTDLPIPERGTARRQVRVIWADTITALAVVWAWMHDDIGRIPAGALSLSAGREGTGKSSFAIWLVARITTGTLPGSFFGTPRRVLYVAVEDSWEHTLVPRLRAAGADLALVGRVDVTSTGDDELSLSLPDDMFELERAIVEHEIALVVLDPLLSMIGESIDTHRNREVREALDPLARLADRTGTVVHGIAHFNKSSGTDAASLITGSGAFKDVPRAVLGFARDDEGRVMTQIKNSLGRDDVPSMSYEITAASVEVKGGLAEVGVLSFTGESTRTVGDVLRDAGGTDEFRSERDEATEWLTAYLIDNHGEARAGDAKKAGREAGIAPRTLERARTRAGVKIHRAGFPAVTVWRLAPTVTPLRRLTRHDVGVGETGETGGDAVVVPISRTAPCGHPIETLHTESGKCPLCIVAAIQSARRGESATENGAM